jgi:membrane-bound lytic murein transglycosylase D
MSMMKQNVKDQVANKLQTGRRHVKSGIRYAILGVLLGIAVLAIVTVVDRWNQSKYAELMSQTHATTLGEPAEAPQYHRNVTQLDVPREVTVFGERIPLDNWEVRERFEREFYYNYQNADQLVLWYKRSARYFPTIQKELDEAGLPSDLKYLAVAESGLRNVTSPAKADGFWQFIPGTAQHYGLRVDNQIDERLDPEKETQAAVAYFKAMKDRLPSWTLVAAGYNMGEDNVLQAMSWQHAQSYWDLYINEETMRYVLRIAAIKELMAHADKYGLDLSHVKAFKTPAVKYETVTGPVASIADWAYGKGYLYKDVKVLNPWLIGRSVPAGTYRIALPLNAEDRASESR